MDKRTLLDKMAACGEERLLLGHIWDKYDQCCVKNIPSATAFLSPQEQMAARRLLQTMGVVEGFVFCGGYEGAERCQLHFLPDWAWEVEEGSIRVIRCTWYRGESPNHRDFLGSLMGLGLTRETIGDILVSEESADVLVTDSVADFLLNNWTAAGRIHLQTQEVSPAQVHIPMAKTKLVRDTVPSLRLDNVVASGFSLSRAKAAEAISGGRVQLNWTPCLKADRTVTEGDTISLRGLGKCVLESIGNETKKGRIFVTVKRFL